MKLFFAKLLQQRALVIMTVPFLLWLILFKYVPIWGWTIAFQDFKPALGFWEQKWIGFHHFEFLFGDERFLRVLRNTLAMSTIERFLRVLRNTLAMST
ncbi:hypothetical protein AB4Z21_32515, partial [Paenibacillus sp. MCAF20]